MRLSPLFHDHAVLQRNQLLPVWGDATPGSAIDVRLGPYYLHALITLLGPVRRVSGLTRTSFAKRTIPLRQPWAEIHNSVGVIDYAHSFELHPLLRVNAFGKNLVSFRIGMS